MRDSARRLFGLIVALLVPCLAEGAPFAYIANVESDSVSVVDTANNAVVATIGVGLGPFSVAVNPAGTKVYVGNLVSKSVSVIDTDTRTVTATIPLGDIPISVAVNPAGTRVYAATLVSSTIAVIDTASNAVVADMFVGTGPGGIAVSPDGTRVYVPVMGEVRAPGSTLLTFDTATNAVVGSVEVGIAPQVVAVNPSGTRLYVTDGENDVSVVDTATNTVVAVVRVGFGPVGVVVNPAGTRVYVANYISDDVSVLDAATNKVVATVHVGAGPAGIDISPTGTRVYTANFDADNVSAIDVATNAVVATIPVGTSPASIGRFIGPQAIATAPAAGVWYDPAEPGTGYGFDYKDGVLIAQVYSYRADGAAQWYLGAGNVAGSQFTATLDKYADGQCISCLYKAPTLVGNDGNFTINFTSATTARVTLPGGRLAHIQRYFAAGAAPPASAPVAGVWYDPAESGTGYALDYKDGVLIVQVYSYLAGGAAQWYLGAGNVTGNVFTATLDRYVGGQCISCAYKVPSLAGNDGVVTIAFTSSTTADVVMPGGRTGHIQRYFGR
jgi:YVTN family beta-propeller protein